MVLNINRFKTTPSHLPFNLCVFGELSEDIKEWAIYHNLKLENSGEQYHNIILPDNINFSDIFEPYKIFSYFDGFSPNLNKHLHLGHLSNLIVAKAIQKLEITNTTIAILGDTLEGEVSKDDALDKYKEYLKKFDYNLNEIFFASERTLMHPPMLLINGTGDYEGTKVFDLGDELIVGIKKTGATTYFYQDVALQQELSLPTLYITGFEQNNHFNSLKKLFRYIEHKGLGLVMLDGKKMSSSEGNVIYAEDILNEFKKKFNGDEKLTYNVLAGQILKYSLETVKNIKKKEIDNFKTSLGLYVSYTMARMFSAGVNLEENIDSFQDKKLRFLEYKSKCAIEPNYLFNGLVDLCKHINGLYVTHKIKDSKENKEMFQTLTTDLVLGCKKLGLFIVNKV